MVVSSVRFSLLGLQRFDQSIQHSPDFGNTLRDWLDVLPGHESEPVRKLELHVNFAP